MAEQKNRYKQLEEIMTVTILADVIFFVLFMILSGLGIVWAKIVLGVLCLLVSGACIAYLYITKELLRPRSMWMTFASGAVALCVVFSLILNFPSPHPKNVPQKEEKDSAAAIVAIYEI